VDDKILLWADGYCNVHRLSQPRLNACNLFHQQRHKTERAIGEFKPV